MAQEETTYPGFVDRIAQRYVTSGKVKLEDIRKEGKESVSRSQYAETLFKTMEALKSSVENLKSKSDAKKFEKAYKDLGKILDKCEKARSKVLKLIEAIDPATVADPDEFKAGKYLVERYNLGLPAMDHEKATGDSAAFKVLRAEQTQGFIWEFEKFMHRRQ
jgi:uncharacterized membrane-anchored protein YjiN (DUF445 family)